MPQSKAIDLPMVPKGRGTRAQTNIETQFKARINEFKPLKKAWTFAKHV